MPPLHIALEGATGNLRLAIFSALLSAGHPVTVLSRRTSTSSSKLPTHPNVKLAHVDFSNTASLIPALTGIQFFSSCLATSALGTQTPLIDAAVANEVAIRLTICIPKVETQAYLTSKTRDHLDFTLTAVACNLFLNWGLETGFILDIKARKATLYNGGDVNYSSTLLADVAKAVLGVVAHPKEMKNRVVYVHSALVTQNLLIQYAHEKDVKDWDTTVKETETLIMESYAELEKGQRADVESALLGFCIVARFDERYECDISAKLNNDVLRVKKFERS